MKRTVVVTSMYAHPLHPGHVDCLELSKELGDELIVIVNNDYQATQKRGEPPFQDEEYRMRIVGALKPVDRVLLAIDTDHTVCATLRAIFTELRNDETIGDIIFAKGGDRFAYEIPESAVCREFNVRIIDGLGAKTHHSSEIVKKAKGLI